MRLVGWRWLAAATALIICALASTSARAEEPERHAVYLELLGKNGLWGVGYDGQWTPWLAVGISGSYSITDDTRISSLSPYVSLFPWRRGHHRWFVHAGPQLVRTTVPSPVPEWDGDRSTGFGAELCSGYEYRNHVLVRIYAMGAVGSGGATPWVGATFGWTL
jgi:hypothetical protein